MWKERHSAILEREISYERKLLAIHGFVTAGSEIVE